MLSGSHPHPTSSIQHHQSNQLLPNINLTPQQQYHTTVSPIHDISPPDHLSNYNNWIDSRASYLSQLTFLFTTHFHFMIWNYFSAHHVFKQNLSKITSLLINSSNPKFQKSNLQLPQFTPRLLAAPSTSLNSSITPTSSKLSTQLHNNNHNHPDEINGTNSKSNANSTKQTTTTTSSTPTGHNIPFVGSSIHQFQTNNNTSQFK